MSDKEVFLNPFIDQLIDAQRISSEGATLKNVSDNMRTLSVLVVVFVAVSAMGKNANPGVMVSGILWGIWAAAYAFLAGLQTGFLFLTASIFLMQRLGYGKLKREWVREVIALFFAMLTLLFMFAAVFLIGASVEIVTSKKS